MKQLNNKGFTLVELLAVLVILIAITSIAIPSISSSIERSKKKQDNDRIKVLENAAQLYVSDHRQKINNFVSNKTDKRCTVTIDELTKNGYLDSEATKDSDGEDFNGKILYDFSNQTYSYCPNDDNCGSIQSCISNSSS